LLVALTIQGPVEAVEWASSNWEGRLYKLHWSRGSGSVIVVVDIEMPVVGKPIEELNCEIDISDDGSPDVGDKVFELPEEKPLVIPL
jgi:hypothetical protein